MKPQCPRFDHVSRRAMLKGTLLTGTGGMLSNFGPLFGGQAAAATAEKQQKHCILLWMNGGASQFETFDMKPGQKTGGLFRPISTNLPGVQVCELLPRISQVMDKLAVIRSMHTSRIDHPGGIHLMHTSYAEAANIRFPEIGAVVAKYHGREDSDLPSFIKVSSNGSSGCGFLGPKYQPFSLDHSGQLPPFSGSGRDAETIARRANLKSLVENAFARQHNAETFRMHREGYDSAVRLEKAQAAFDVSDEWEKYKDRYGDSKFGFRCLLARRLIEQGVPFVEVGQSGYDTHADNFAGHKGLLPPMDQAWAALLVDLEERGLLENTLVIWMGEIGRTPNINNRSGRDHFVKCWSTALAGCGIVGGTVYGSTNKDGTDVADQPVTEGDFFATVYQALGINPLTEHYAGVRPIPVAPFGSNVVTSLLG